MDVCLIEGAVCNEDNLELLHKIRARTKVLVSFGDCAVTGNVPAIRNQLGSDNAESVLQRAYVERAQDNPPHARSEPGIVPPLLDRGAARARGGARRPLSARLPAARRPHQGACSVQVLDGDEPQLEGTQTQVRLIRDLFMSQRIVIDPVTRIEGHAKISIFLDDAGNVSDAEFHVVEFRGFEKFCEGRPFGEMPGITPRICGICPVSHLLASAKAGDAIMAVNIPPAADKLRRLMNLGQIVQSHALSFFHLSAPDFLLGWDTPRRKRNVFGLIAANADLARAGIRLRQFGQEIIEMLGGKKIHPAWAVPGGVRSPLTEEGRDADPRLAARGLRHHPDRARAVQEGCSTRTSARCRSSAISPRSSWAWSTPDGTWEHHGGKLRFIDSSGSIIADQLDPAELSASSSARRCRTAPTSSRPTTCRWASRTACTASARWPGSTSASTWARPRPTPS